jgi:hypothetical protein
MGQYASGSESDALLTELAELRRRIASLETAAPLRNASISDGGQLVIKGRAGQTLVLLGRSDDETLNAPDGQAQMLLQVFRTDGTKAFAMWDPAPAVDGFNQFVAMYDRAGNNIFSDDTTSGVGLAKPYLPVPFYDYPAVPTQTTTSATFTTLQRAAAHVKQHPRIQVGLLILTSADTTGEVRLWDSTNNVRIGSTLTIAANTFGANNIGPDYLLGAHMDTLDLDIQARRTGGTGTIGVRAIGGFAVQS